MSSTAILSRPVLLRRAVRLEALTLAWNIVEGVVGVGAAHARSARRHHQRVHDVPLARSLRRSGEAENRAPTALRRRVKLARVCYRSCYRSAKFSQPLAKECDPSGIRELDFAADAAAVHAVGVSQLVSPDPDNQPFALRLGVPS